MYITIMVKNEKGGSKHKKFARKNVKGNSGFDERVRKSTHADEIYASVSKILGNGRVEILCNDGKSRQCVIRNKFRGKNKRNNELTTGALILAGRRSWETPNPDKMETCDLLCVYNNSHINKLKTEPTVNMALLQSTSKSSFDKDAHIDFFDRWMPEEMVSDDECNSDNENNAQDVEQNTKIQDANEDFISLMNMKNEDIVNVDDI
jgi:initiation factor 1A